MKSALIGLVLMLASAPAFAWTCYSVNSGNVPFYGIGYTRFQAAENAMASCRLNTPYGWACFVTTCGF